MTRYPTFEFKWRLVFLFYAAIIFVGVLIVKLIVKITQRKPNTTPHHTTQQEKEGLKTMGWNPDESARRIDMMRVSEIQRQQKAIREQKAIQDAIKRKDN